MKNKTVFDVNIWISYFIAGKSEEIVDMVENNDVFFYRSAQLMRELKEVINRPKFAKYFPNGTVGYVLFVEQLAEHFSTYALFNQCADPKDNYLFDLAYQSHSDYLVSGDKRVLAVPIVGQSLRLLSLSAFKMAIGLLPPPSGVASFVTPL
ncbi:MAG: putative toxin-antitoxin system toxin component, PIN family [Prevotellaceae bacterium]|jgi:putative PIN family toxin of toxin-antitoxin system|nr:putative toxin-antitoxin system toxin component, PIN family [Prevotellaceae bacterium]